MRMKDTNWCGLNQPDFESGFLNEDQKNWVRSLCDDHYEDVVKTKSFNECKKVCFQTCSDCVRSLDELESLREKFPKVW